MNEKGEARRGNWGRGLKYDIILTPSFIVVCAPLPVVEHTPGPGTNTELAAQVWTRIVAQTPARTGRSSSYLVSFS
jgi:hypothetical protein